MPPKHTHTHTHTHTAWRVSDLYTQPSTFAVNAATGLDDLIAELTRSMKVAKLQDDDVAAVAYCLVNAASQTGEAGARVRNNSGVLGLVALLRQSTARGVKELAVMFPSVQEKQDGAAKGASADTPPAPAVVSLAAAKMVVRPPGERDHDNDKHNFRDISITPTPSELSCQEPAYLPPMAGPGLIDNKEAALLDRQFRLVREDLVGKVKEEIAEEFDEGKGNQQRKLFHSPELCGFALHPQPHFVMRVRLTGALLGRIKSKSDKDAYDFFDKGPGRRVFGHGQLVLLFGYNDGDKVAADSGQHSKKKRHRQPPIVAVGVVCERMIGKAPQKSNALMIGVAFEGDSITAMVKHLHRLEYAKDNRVRIGTYLLSSSVGFFSIDPVLQGLQSMTSVPHADVLVHGQPTKPPEAAHKNYAIEQLSSTVQKAVEADPTQKQALQQVFDSQVVLVQGPPGTGKTYLGVQMVKAMLEAYDTATFSPAGIRPPALPLQILCICYTNHALDSFLESLLDAGVEKDLFVRLGKSPKISERLRELCLEEKKNPFTPAETRQFASIKEEQKCLEGKIETVERKIKKANWGTSLSWWHTISEWLQDEHYELHDQFVLPGGLLGGGRSQKRGGNDFVTVGADGKKAIQANYLWERWCRGKDRGILDAHAQGQQKQKQQKAKAQRSTKGGSLWLLSKDERVALRDQWNTEYLSVFQDKLASYMLDLRRAADMMRLLKRKSKHRALSAYKIIGCTTVAAANLGNLLQPTVVLVEEAAEILEAHVLTNISSRCQQIIMIGDHKQLRPKIEMYTLRKECPTTDYDADVSLFERLVLQGSFDLVELGVQHRMRPDLSVFPRTLLYPNLQDHESVRGREDVVGVRGNCIFIDHACPEAADEDAAALGSKSKVNPHEVNMVVAIAQHLRKQGTYRASDITILTPYLGQLAEIKQKLVDSSMGASINDLDHRELREANLTGTPAKPDTNSGLDERRAASNSVRVATIDNYQGEEAEIIIVSLVRSNKDRDIGFLSAVERVNVMLTRARLGMYIIGNMASFVNCRSSRGRQLWKSIEGIFRSPPRQLLDHFPIKCKNHGTVSNITAPEDFASCAPDGGCGLPCVGTLLCGHACPRKCHVDAEAAHQSPASHGILCRVVVHDVCSYGHTGKRKCHEETFVCQKFVEWTCSVGHAQSGKCFAGRLKPCGRCKDEEERQKAADAAEEKRARAMADARSRISVLQEQLFQLQHVEEQRAEQEVLNKELEYLERQLMEVSTPSSTENARASFVPTESPADMPATRLDASCPRRGDPSAQDGFDHRLVQFIAPFIDQAPSRSVLLSTLFAKVYNSGIFEKAAVQSHMKKRGGATKYLQLILGGFGYTLSGNGGTVAICAAKERATPTGTAPKLAVANNDPPPKGQGLRKPEEPDDSKGFATVESSSELTGSGATKDDGSPKVTGKCNTVAPKSANQSIAAQHSAVERVMDAYKRHGDDGALKAHDVLEQVADGTGQCQPLQALKVILEKEIGANTTTRCFPYPDPEQSITTLSSAVCAWAFLITLPKTCPVQAEMVASKMQHYIRSYPNALPEAWQKPHSKIPARLALRVQPTSLHNTVHDRVLELQQEWAAIIGDAAVAPAIMGDVLSMIGLDDVKLMLMKLYQRFEVARAQGDSQAGSYNARFDGNPGTGKTTVARHYGTFLKELGIFTKSPLFLDTSGASLIHKGVDFLEEQLQKAKDCGGGVIFVDEAYLLVSDRIGKQILDFILPIASGLETEYGPLVWVFAGYKKDMDKLFEHNPGLPSRFPHYFHFADFSDQELLEIFLRLLKTKPVQPASKKPAAPPRPSARLQRPRYISSYSRTPDGTTMKDTRGHVWTYSAASQSWHDDFNNVTGYDPATVGTNSNPLCASDGSTWVHGAGTWTDLASGATQQTRPGEPAPISASAEEREDGQKFRCENVRYARIATRRLGRQRGRVGFGNARAVRNYFDKVKDQQAARISGEKRASPGASPDLFMLTRTDLIGTEPTEKLLKASAAYRKLSALEGLKPVKESVDKMITLVVRNAQKELQEKPIQDVVLNRIFLGNPGTGKTTVAKIYAQLLTEMGLLSKGEVILKTVSDFVGSVLGSSEKTTRSILRTAEGSVLVIDEAYSLYTGSGTGGASSSDPYKTAVVDTIVEQVQATAGDDRAVILLGYEKEMRVMLSNVNPGLSRRFQLENAFEFPDYSDTALLRIMLSKIEARGLTIATHVAKRAVGLLAKARAKPHFGNAGSIENLICEAVQRQQNRGSDAFVLADFGLIADKVDHRSLDTLFDDLIGSEAIKGQLRNLRDLVEFEQQQGKDPKGTVGFNYIFSGNPGTGKTTVARRMGIMFKSLGLLPDDTVREISPSEISTGYVGQTGGAMREHLRQSRGGVLFIDEAYQLNPERGGSFMTEAVDELVKCLTSEEYKGKVLVILAGYKDDMRDLLRVNTGLKSRFSEHLDFVDLDAPAIASLLAKQLEAKGLQVTQPCRPVILECARQLAKMRDFGNGRDVETMSNKTYMQAACSKQTSLAPAHLNFALAEMLENRQPDHDDQAASGKPAQAGLRLKELQSSVNPPPLPAMATRARSATVVLDTLAATDTAALVANEDAATEISGKDLEPVVPRNWFADVDTRVLGRLQQVLDSMGLNTEEGMATVNGMQPGDPQFLEFVRSLQETLGLSETDAAAAICTWTRAYQKMAAKRKQLKAQKKRTMQPIWRCAVCGRADLPQIVCYVAPYIVRYQPVDM